MLLREPVLRKPDELADGAARACPEDIDDDFMSGPVPVLSSSQHDHPIASSDHALPATGTPHSTLPSGPHIANGLFQILRALYGRIVVHRVCRELPVLARFVRREIPIQDMGVYSTFQGPIQRTSVLPAARMSLLGVPLHRLDAFANEQTTLP